MKSKVFFSSVIFFILGSVAFVLNMAILGLCIYVIIIDFDIDMLLILIAVFLFSLMAFKVSYYQNMTFVKINESGLTLYGILGRRKKINWEDIAKAGVAWGAGTIPELVFYFVENSEQAMNKYKEGKRYQFIHKGYLLNFYGAGKGKNLFRYNTRKGLMFVRITKKTMKMITNYYKGEIEDLNQFFDYLKSTNRKWNYE